MKVYSDFASRRALQVVLDFVALAAIVLSIVLGVFVHGAIVKLTSVGRGLEDAGAGFQKNMSDAAKTLAGIPLVGNGVKTPFVSASEAGATLASSGRSEQEVVMQLATVLGIVVALVPLYFVVRYLLVRRVRFAIAASRVSRLARSQQGIELLAFRALAGADGPAVLKVHAAPVEAWRRGEPAVIRSLAALELREAGVRLEG